MENLDNKKIIAGIPIEEFLFPNVDKNISFYEKKYPKRNLTIGAKVTRIAPSPTGPMHIGGLYMALVSKRIAKQTNGIFFLRIEDTDKKREVPGAFKLIIKSLEKYSLQPDEGPIDIDKSIGDYGPYVQSERLDIYQAFVKDLLKKNKAYPCFLTEDELSEIKQKQESAKIKPGYYGSWAVWRNKSAEDIEKAITKGIPFVIRFKSENHIGSCITVDDLIRGSIKMPANDMDFILLKKDGTPTYHLAHVVDDYLMGTTDVLRADEWISSLPIHHDLFNAFGFKFPNYGHISPIQKISENSGKRKLSKRKDPEASIEYYNSIGYKEEAVIEYLLNLADPNFEPWRSINPYLDISLFKMDIKGLGGGGPLFDEKKLKDISRNVISKLSAEELYDYVLEWSELHNSSFKKQLENDKDYSISVFNIERNIENPRKDIASFSEIPKEFDFFFDSNFVVKNKFIGKNILSENEQKEIVKNILENLDFKKDRDAWFIGMQELALKFNFAPNIKALKEHPDRYRGQVGEITQLLRFVLTGKEKTPDLYQIIITLGKDEVQKRLRFFIDEN